MTWKRLASHILLTVVPAAAWTTACGASGAPGGAARAVTEHHGGARRDGVYVDATLTRSAARTFHPDVAFKPSLRGAVYAQPLFFPSRSAGGKDLVVVATEQNDVAAIDPATGSIVWTRHLADAVPQASLPCGNIDPLGVTGTPVADADTRTLYLDAMTTPDGGTTKHHLVYALSVDDGSIRPGWPVAIRDLLSRRGLAFEDATQNQRGALALANGILYVPFGGHFGDCGDYRGWLVAIPVAQPGDAAAWSTAARGGGSWGPGGVAADSGSVFLATGNTFGAKTWSGGEAVLRFTVGAPLAQPSDWFAPLDWKNLDDEDTDIGGSGPVLVDVAGATPSALVVALGKDGKIYLLDRAHLGGIGGELASAQVAAGPIINAAAAYTTARGTYVVFTAEGRGCPNGQPGDLTAVRIVAGRPPSVQVAWCAHQGGTGSPMVTTTDGHSEAVVWTIGAEGDERLRAFDGDTGQVLYAAPGGEAFGTVRRFQTPILAAGRIFVAIDGGVRSFSR